MLPSRKWRLLVFILAAVSRVTSVYALVSETHHYRGTEVQCLHGGAWIFETRLGVYRRARLYEQVFTGTVQSVVEISFTDKRLQITPDEIFLGDVAGEITATVNQACLPENLPEIKAGDKWLFYLKTKRYLHPDAKPPVITSDGLMVVFDSPSKPVSEAEYDVCLLRLHSDLHSSCIALLPTGPRGPDVVCEWNRVPFPLTSPFARPVPFQEPSKNSFQQDGIDLAHLSVPPELRVPDRKTANSARVIQTRPWRPSCSPEW
jgi:hypothetical protein